MVFVLDGRILGQDRDTPFAFQVIAVHHAFTGTGANGSSLLQEFVHQGGFAMIDMSDDGHIAKDMIGH